MQNIAVGICALLAAVLAIAGCVTPYIIYKGDPNFKEEGKFMYQRVEMCVQGTCHDQDLSQCKSLKHAGKAVLTLASLGIISSLALLVTATLGQLKVVTLPRKLSPVLAAVGLVFYFVVWPIAISLFTENQCGNSSPFKGKPGYGFGPSPFLFLAAFSVSLFGAIAMKLLGGGDDEKSSAYQAV